MRFGLGPGRGLRLGNASECEVGKGLLYPSLVSPNTDRTKYRLMFRLLPGYLGSEGAVQASLGLTGFGTSGGQGDGSPSGNG